MTPQRLLAFGPIPRRLAPDTESLFELVAELEAGLLGASGVYDMPDEFRSQAA